MWVWHLSGFKVMTCSSAVLSSQPWRKWDSVTEFMMTPSAFFLSVRLVSFDRFYVIRFYCVFEKRITLCNCLCYSSSNRSSGFSASRVMNIVASNVGDFGPTHSVKSQVYCYTTSTSRQKTWIRTFQKTIQASGQGYLLGKTLLLCETFNFIFINN